MSPAQSLSLVLLYRYAVPNKLFSMLFVLFAVTTFDSMTPSETLAHPLSAALSAGANFPTSFSITGSPNPEPDNHPTNFSVTATGVTTITNTWTDSIGPNLPSRYLVLCNLTGTFTNPVDTIEQSDDLNCADGSGVQNVSQGTQTATWPGLSPNQYFFKIFPYTNSSSTIDFKIDETPAVGNVTLVTPLIINEVDYDQPSTDVAEFIEIKNISANTLNLGTYVINLINGVGTTSYEAITLPSFNLPAGDYYVICGDATNVANCDLDVAPNTNLIQNGAPDAIAIEVNSVIIDAVSYEGNTGTPYTEGTGLIMGDNNVDAFLGISRFPDMVDTNNNNTDFSQRCITPGLANTNPASTDCEKGTLTVTKVVTNDNGGALTIDDFPLFVSGVSVTSGATVTLTAGTYSFTETNQSGYTASYGGDCDSNGKVSLAIGDAKSCILFNDDQMGVTLDISDGLTVSEGSITDTYTIVLDSVPTATVTIAITPDEQLDLGNGPAVAISRIFNADNSALVPQSITVAAYDDAFVEGSQSGTIIHSLSSTDPSYNATTPFSPTKTLVANITDNDNQTLSLIGTSGSEANLAASVQLTATVDITSTQNVTFTVHTVDGTAMLADNDFVTEPATSTLTIPSGSLSTTFTLLGGVKDDNTIELDEVFYIDVLAASDLVTPNPMSATITILNDDIPDLMINDVSTSEVEGVITFTVSLSQAINTPVTVEYTTSTNSATSADFTSINTPQTLTFSPTQTQQEIFITIIDDAFDEEDQEIFYVNLANATNANIIDSQGEATIDDDDVPMLSVTGSTITEGDAYTYTVTSDITSTRTITFIVGTSPGSASSGTDYYDITNRQDNIISGQTTTTVSQGMTLTDTEVEGSETFTVTLTDSSSFASILTAQDVITIIDDGTPRLFISPTMLTISEASGSAVFMASLTHPPTTTVTVDLTVIGDECFVTPNPVTMTSSTYTGTSIIVTANDDNLIDGNQPCAVQVSNTSSSASLFNNVAPDNDTVSITVIDNDTLPNVSIDQVTVAEAAGSANFIVTLSGPSDNDITVNYTTIDGSATAQDDYISVSGMVTFTLGITQQTITVPILADDQLEISETATVILSNSVNATLNDPPEATLTILDSTHQQQLSISAPNISNPSTDTTPSGQSFWGQYGNETVNITFNNLGPHQQAEILFDLFIIRSWDGNLTHIPGTGTKAQLINPKSLRGIGPDIWQFDVDASNLLRTTFSNWDESNFGLNFDQAYPGSYPGSHFPSRTGAAEIGSLDFGFGPINDLDSVYPMRYTINHTDTTLTLSFTAEGLQALDDESWGLANIEVTLLTEFTSISDHPLYLPLVLR